MHSESPDMKRKCVIDANKDKKKPKEIKWRQRFVFSIGIRTSYRNRSESHFVSTMMMVKNESFSEINKKIINNVD